MPLRRRKRARLLHHCTTHQNPRGGDVSARTGLHWVQQVAPLLAGAGRQAAARPGRRWWCDETYVRVGGQWAYRYRAIDEQGQVIDVLLRTHRDRASVRACCILALHRRRVAPDEVITDQHAAYLWAVREEVPPARHTRRGRQRTQGPDTKPVERSQGPVKDRLRPLRGLQTVQRGYVVPPGAAPGSAARPHVRARAAAATFAWLAARLRVAA